MFNAKKSFFSKKIKQVEKATWDLEFKLFKVREMREERRKQHDRGIEMLNVVENKLKTEKNEEEVKKLEAQKEEATKYHAHVLSQMQALDSEINGVAATETSEKYPGVLEQIEAARELKQMYEDYRKSL
jgi:hypothetical protein